MGTRTVHLRTQAVDISTHNETARINHHAVQYSLHCQNENSLARAEVDGIGCSSVIVLKSFPPSILLFATCPSFGPTEIFWSENVKIGREMPGV